MENNPEAGQSAFAMVYVQKESQLRSYDELCRSVECLFGMIRCSFSEIGEGFLAVLTSDLSVEKQNELRARGLDKNPLIVEVGDQFWPTHRVDDGPCLSL